MRRPERAAFCFLAHLWHKFGPVVAQRIASKRPSDLWAHGPLLHEATGLGFVHKALLRLL